MSDEFSAHNKVLPTDANATHPIELPDGALAALLLLAGKLPRRRRALPSRRPAAHLGASNRRF